MTHYIKYVLLLLLIVLSCAFYLNKHLSDSDMATGEEWKDKVAANDYVKDDRTVLAAERDKDKEPTDVFVGGVAGETSGVDNAEQQAGQAGSEELLNRGELLTTVMLHIFDRGYTEPPEWDEKLIQQLSFLQSPIPGAKVSTRDSHLPGAPRAYRNGTHEGLDYYDGFCGVSIRFDDPVYAAASGIVVRVDHDYEEPTVAERDKMLRKSAAAGDTPPYILDKLRGRQVWLAHPHNVITRYAHMNTLCENIQTGDWIEAGEYIGTLGNSGTSNGARGTREDAHLHFEIWVENHYLGEGLPLQEIKLLWQQLLE